MKISEKVKEGAYLTVKNQKYKPSVHLLILILFLFVLTALFVVYANFSQQYYADTLTVHNVEYMGSYSLDGQNVFYDIPENHNIRFSSVDKVKKVRLLLRFNEKISQNQTINLFSQRTKIRVHKNDGSFADSYGYSGRIANIIPEINDWYSVAPMELTPKDTFIIEIISDEVPLNDAYINYFLKNIMLGSREDLLKNNIGRNLIHIIIAGCIFVMGFVLCTLMFTFQLMNSPVHIGDFSCSFLMMCGALIIFFNYDYITLIFKNALLVNFFDMLNHMLILFFLMMYFNVYVHGKKVKSAVKYFIYLWGMLIIFFLVPYTLTEISSETVCNGLLIPSIIIVAVTSFFLIIDYSHIENTNSKIMIGSGLIMCVTSFSELICRLLKGYFLHYAFEVGLIMFSLIQFIAIMIVAKRNILRASRAKYIENELLQSKISIMLSQIQPHFLYNTLVVIRHLCEKNPKVAKEAITEFANYLRGNLDSLTLNTTIPFEKEMEHVENYVSLEKKRFGDKIEIDYDIEAVNFEVPSLTIQTIVENAIRHGITKRKQGGTVTIITRENAYNHTIEIKDNGIGINMTQKSDSNNDNRSHIGVENARTRIETMCNGTLDFQSTPNVGTTVLITIPKRNSI